MEKIVSNEKKLLQALEADTIETTKIELDKLYSTQSECGKTLLSESLFSSMNLNKKLEEKIYEMGIEKPSLIQSVAIPNILKNKNLAFHSKSGTGKTIAFVVSALNIVVSGNGPQVLVLAPTRELSNQIRLVFEDMASSLGIEVCGAVGSFTQDVVKEEIIVGTPGKICRLLSKNIISRNDIKLIIFDEADVLISERAFGSITLKLLNMLKNAQRVFFSATYSDFAKESIKMLVPDVEAFFEKNDKPKNINVFYIKVDPRKKIETVDILFSVLTIAQCIIFVGRKDTAQYLSKKLANDNFNVSCIHGDLSPLERDRAATDFANAQTKVLVATDVYSRGIDIPQVNLIINYDLPYDDDKFQESYIHRIGRSGRFNRNGFVIDFISSEKDLELLQATSVYKNVESLEIDIQKLMDSV